MSYDWSTLLQFLISGLSNGCAYGLVAIGFSVIFNASGIINFGQGAFVMMGGMITYALINFLAMPLYIAVVVAIILVTGIGLGLELVAIRPLWRRQAPLFVLIIATLVAQVGFENAALHALGTNPFSFPAFSQGDPVQVFGASISRQYFWIFGCSLGLVVALGYLYRRTMLGKAMRACAVNREFAQLLGIPVERMLASAFAVSAALGAVAGILLTPIQYTAYNVALAFTINGFVAAVIGGLGNPLGAFVGGLVLGALESVALVFIESGYKEVVVFSLLLLILLFKPTGLFGSLVEET